MRISGGSSDVCSSDLGVSHIELRDLDDDDLDAVFDMMREPEAVSQAAFTASDPDDRAAFDTWIDRQRTSADVRLWVVTDDGGFAGTAAAFTIDGDRAVTYWIAHHARGRSEGDAAHRCPVAHAAQSPPQPRGPLPTPSTPDPDA